VTLPAVTASPGTQVILPVTIGDTTGAQIISYDLQITFDSSVVQPSSPSYDTTGTLSSNMAITPNADNSGHLVISAFQTDPIAGAGTLINLKFTVVGTSGQSTAMTFADYTDGLGNFHPGCQLNEGTPGCATTNGSVSIFGVAISGTVTYGNPSGSPTPRFVSNVTITGNGSPNVSTTTAAPGANAGQYALSGFGPGAYTVVPSKNGGVNGGITSFDAARVAQHVAGTNMLTGNALIVADVSANGTVTSFDSAQIASYVVSGSNPGVTGTWRFAPASRPYASVTSSISGQDYTALLMGEVSGNWLNTGARAVNAAGPESVSVSAPRLVTSANGEILMPVSVENVVNKGVIAYEFDLRYDPLVVQPQADPVDLIGSVSRGLTAVAKTDEPGLLRVAVYGALPIDSNGLLLTLKFTAIGTPSSVTPLTWERFMFNEGDATTLAANGEVEIAN
jgi:Cohesin domain/Dockerin type I domain